MARILAFVALVLVLVSPAKGQVIEGFASAHDGDTISMTGSLLRLAHIDAPEAEQTCERDGEVWACGAAATQVLASLVNDKRLSCIVVEAGQAGTLVAECQAKGIALGPEMVRQGMAVTLADAPYAYQESESIAQGMNFGLWASKFEPPSVWRDAHPQAAEAHVALPAQNTKAASAPQPLQEHVYRTEYGCAIKGNRNRRGEWIYHLPGQAYYNQTRPEELFCTESEAMAAGYRRSKV